MARVHQRLLKFVYKISCCFVKFCISMSESSDRPSQCEIWADIKFPNKEKVGAREIHWRLCAVNGEDGVMLRCNVYRWVEMFKVGYRRFVKRRRDEKNMHDTRNSREKKGSREITWKLITHVLQFDYFLVQLFYPLLHKKIHLSRT